jgi:hypothetical protein
MGWSIGVLQGRSLFRRGFSSRDRGGILGDVSA